LNFTIHIATRTRYPRYTGRTQGIPVE